MCISIEWTVYTWLHYELIYSGSLVWQYPINIRKWIIFRFFHGRIILIDHDHWSRYICYNYKHNESISNDDCIFWRNMKEFFQNEEKIKKMHHDHHIYDRALFQFVNYSLHFVWWYKIEIDNLHSKNHVKCTFSVTYRDLLSINENENGLNMNAPRLYRILFKA